MRIRNIEEAEKVKELLSPEEYKDVLDKLQFVEDWDICVFTSNEEIDADADLLDWQKERIKEWLERGGRRVINWILPRQQLRPTKRPCGCEPHGSIH